MPWNNENYPDSLKNFTAPVRNKAIEIANWHKKRSLLSRCNRGEEASCKSDELAAAAYHALHAQ